MLGYGGAGELLRQQAGKEQHGTAWPVTRHDLFRLPGGVEADQDDTADGLATDLCDVVLEKAVVAKGAAYLNSCRSYSERMVITTDRTAAAPCTTPSNIEPSTVASSAMLSSHAGR